MTARCRTCARFDPAVLGESLSEAVQTTWEWNQSQAEHASHAAARNAPFGVCQLPEFSGDTERLQDDEVAAVRMIVADGHNSHAVLYVHREHSCAQWTPATPRLINPPANDLLLRQQDASMT